MIYQTISNRFVPSRVKNKQKSVSNWKRRARSSNSTSTNDNMDVSTPMLVNRGPKKRSMEVVDMEVKGGKKLKKKKTR